MQVWLTGCPHEPEPAVCYAARMPLYPLVDHLLRQREPRRLSRAIPTTTAPVSERQSGKYEHRKDRTSKAIEE